MLAQKDLSGTDKYRLVSLAKNNNINIIKRGVLCVIPHLYGSGEKYIWKHHCHCLVTILGVLFIEILELY